MLEAAFGPWKGLVGVEEGDPGGCGLKFLRVELVKRFVLEYNHL